MLEVVVRVPVVVLALVLALLGLAAPAGATGNGVILSLGDSVPAGARCGCAPYPVGYARSVAAATGRTVALRNLAVSGATTDDVVRQLGTDRGRTLARSAGTAVVMIGANDAADAFDRVLDHQQGVAAALGPVAAHVQARVTTIVRRLQALRPGITVVVLGYWNVVKDGSVGRAAYGTWGEAMAVRATAYVDRALVAAATTTHARYVSTYAPVKGVDGRTDPTPLLAADGDHPNARGHAVIARALAAAAPRG